MILQESPLPVVTATPSSRNKLRLSLNRSANNLLKPNFLNSANFIFKNKVKNKTWLQDHEKLKKLILNNSTTSTSINTLNTPDLSSQLKISNQQNSNLLQNTITYTYNDFNNILPMQIKNFRIKKITWDNFQGQPDPDSIWKAHTYWNLGYTYDLSLRKMKRNNNIRYNLNINPICNLSNQCWVREKLDRLLEHETGHYLIGCMCAMEFKKRLQGNGMGISQLELRSWKQAKSSNLQSKNINNSSQNMMKKQSIVEQLKNRKSGISQSQKVQRISLICLNQNEILIQNKFNNYFAVYNELCITWKWQQKEQQQFREI